MSREAVRQVIVAQVAALKATWVSYALEVEYPNRAINWDALGAQPALCVEIEFTDGHQVDLGHTPQYRGIGYLKLAAVVKEGSGAEKANNLLEHFYPKLHLRDFLPVRFQAVRHLKMEPKQKGLASFSVIIPFYYDTLFVS
jgi:hypothetical protein